MKTKLKQRQRLILEALVNCGRPATTREVAQKAKLNVNGVSQTLGSLVEYVTYISSDKGSRWKLISRKLPPISKPLWNKLNSRRIELIGKKVEGVLSQEETLELQDLQKTADRIIDAVDSLKPALRRLKRLQRRLGIA